MGIGMDVEPQFEQTDLEGASTHFNGSVNLTPIAIPSYTSGPAIAEVLIHNPPTNAHGKFLFLSIDGGLGYMLIENKTYIGWTVRGGINQVFLQGNASGVNFELVLNTEPAPC